MDVTIETNKGKSFKMEIGFFDTVREIKEKVEKYHGVPVAKQSLYIHGAAMADERDTEYYEVLEGSKIQLVVEPDEGEKEENEDHEEREEEEGERKRRRLNILINIPATKRQVAVEVEGGETVGWLKEMIVSEGLAAGRVALVVGGVEMQEQQRTLEEYGVGEGMEVSVVTRTAPTATATASSVGGKRMTVMVLPKGGTKKIAVEVNVMDNVREMRKELERLQSLQHLSLPPEGYFFIYKQDVMEEDHSFRWHGVRPNDTIEIFNGSVTGGS